MSESQSNGIKFLRLSQSCVRVLGNWVEAVQSGLFMGMINDEQFQYFDTYPFDESTHIDVSAESELGLETWETRIAKQHLAGKHSLLVIAAGGNRELVGFHDLGHKTTGLEYGEVLCEASRQALITSERNVSIEHVNRLSIPGDLESYDAAFIARKYISHVHDRSKRIELLRNIRKALKNGSVLAFGFYTREHDGLSFRAQALVANMMRKLRGHSEQRVETGDHLDPDTPLFHHHFILDELNSELHEAGFELVDNDNDWFGWAVARAI